MPADPLSILHLTAGSDAGGLSRYILDLCVAMKHLGHRVAVAGDVGAWQDRFDSQQIEYLRIPLKGGPLAFLRSKRAVRAFVRAQGGFNVYHAHYRRAALLGRALQRRSPAPLLYTVHLSHIDVSGHRRLLTDFGDYTHFASVDALKWACERRLCTRDRSRVIPHGIDLTRYRPPTAIERGTARAAFDIPADARVAAYVGRLDDPKNVDWILDVAAAWDETTYGPLRLLLAGDGPHRTRIAARIQRDGLQDQVRLLGEIDPLPVYHAADAFLLPSSREGFSYVCAEAMACGLPVLRTRTSGSTETVEEGITGKSAPIQRHAFVGDAIRFLSQAGPESERMGLAARRLAEERFDLTDQVTRTLELYALLRSQRAGQNWFAR